MPGKYLYVVRMDVEHDREALFNEVYDAEHIPEISKVPGMLRATRYRTDSPSEPRYLGLYELENPDTPYSPPWQTARDIGRWPTEVRPHTMNRYHAIYSWVGGSRELTGRTRYLYVAMMDVERHKEALFNEVYESEHIPLITKVPGVVNAVRYKTTAEGHPQYVAIYEIERPDVPPSAAFAAASDTGRWKPEVRPYTYNKHRTVYERIGRGQ